ncbi:MAG: prepilin-type N-terminal cleavage/methylation domain-containing protein [Candidatus Paceibacterota bacterium]
MQNKIKNKAFTLIELLVVIAIIGILAGIIVVAMGNSQKAANDAKVQSTMSQMRTAAQLYYMSHSYSYSSLASDTDYAKLATSLSTISTVTTIIKTDNSAYCTYATLPSAPTTYWCVDSIGNSKVSAIANCTTNNANCN